MQHTLDLKTQKVESKVVGNNAMQTETKRELEWLY